MQMSITLKRLTDAPIILEEFTGDFALQDVLDTYAFTAYVIDKYPDKKVHHVQDIRQAALGFPVVMQVIKESNPSMHGSNIDEHV